VPKYIDCYHKYGDNTDRIRQCVTNGD
jgi:hypothetical protein